MKLEKILLPFRQKLARTSLKRVSTGHISNGMRFYTQYDTQAHVAGIGVRAGSVNDPSHLRGMAHLTEHMIARETKQHSFREADLMLRAYGAGPRKMINISTYFNATTYLTDMLIARSCALDAFHLFSGMVKYRDFTQVGLDVELAAVLNEYYHHGEDDMEWMIFQLLHRAMYERNPVRNRIDCEPDELRRVTLEDIRRFADTYYVPANMFAVVLGPKFEEARALVEQEFGHLKPGKIIPPVDDFSEKRPELSGIKSVEIDRKGIHVWHVGIGFPTDPWGTHNEEAIDMLAEILSFRVESMLRDQNRRWGEGTYHPFAYAYRTYLHGILYIWYETPSESFAREAEDRIIRECERIKSGGVSEQEIVGVEKRSDEVSRRRQKRYDKELREEWQMAQVQEYAEYVGAFRNSTGELAELIVDAAANASPKDWEAGNEMRWLNNRRRYLSAIKPRQIIEAANKYLTTPDRYVRVVIRPIDPNPPIIVKPRIILPGEPRDWRFE